MDGVRKTMYSTMRLKRPEYPYDEVKLEDQMRDLATEGARAFRAKECDGVQFNVWNRAEYEALMECMRMVPEMKLGVHFVVTRVAD